MSKSCCGKKDTNDVRKICEKLAIDFYALDYRSKFKQTVLSNFHKEYRTGRTPNPCVICNNLLKFGALLETASAMDAEYLATGHYVNKRWNDTTKRYELWKGPQKDDQSYFLFGLSQIQLEKALFPLASLDKANVRKYAKQYNFPVHNKPGSQDLCFLPGGEYRDVLRAHHPELFEPGELVHVSGDILGEHDGVGAYTIGQRKGLGIAWPERLYVVKIDAQNNRIVVGEREHLLNDEITVGEVNWLSIPPPSEPLRATIKIRYNHTGAQGTVHPLANNRASVHFDRPQSSPAPGQAAVFYDGDIMLGGGFIE